MEITIEEYKATWKYVTRIMPFDIFNKPKMLGSNAKIGFAANRVNIIFDFNTRTFDISFFREFEKPELKQATFLFPLGKEDFLKKLFYHCGDEIIKHNPELKQQP